MTGAWDTDLLCALRVSKLQAQLLRILLVQSCHSNGLHHSTVQHLHSLLPQRSRYTMKKFLQMLHEKFVKQGHKTILTVNKLPCTYELMRPWTATFPADASSAFQAPCLLPLQPRSWQMAQHLVE